MKIIKNKKPICFVENQIIFNSANRLYFYDAHSLERKKKIVLPYPWYKIILSKNKFLRRMLRLDVTNGHYSNGKIFITFNEKLFSIDYLTFEVNIEYHFNKNRKALNLTEVVNSNNFENGLYFGEYFNNPAKEEVNIVKRDESGKFSVAYTFSKGSINHVHNIIPDPYNDCLWVLTGDFGNAASIWQAKDNFKIMNPILYGSQQYRACIAFPNKNGLLFATDTQFEENHINLLYTNGDKWEVKKIFKVNGSVIYGCRFKNKCVFSTATEPAISKKSKIGTLLEIKRGPGILENESHIIMGDLINGFEIITKKKKDILPYRLFQFGAIHFPHGNNPTNNLFSYSIGNIGNDMDTEIRAF